MSWGQNYFVSTDWQEILPPKKTKNRTILIPNWGSSIHIIMTLEDNYLSMKSLIDAQKSMISSDFSKRAYALLKKSSDITDLVDNLRTLTIARLFLSLDYNR